MEIVQLQKKSQPKTPGREIRSHEAATPDGTAALPLASEPSPEKALPSLDPSGAEVSIPDRNTQVELALYSLIAVLDEMAKDDSFKLSWKAARNSGVVYTGPTWKDALDNAKQILNTK